MATNLGAVEYAIFFLGSELWMRNGFPQNNTISYVLFRNLSLDFVDERSSQWGVNVPLIVLQKSIETQLLQHQSGSPVAYDLDYGNMWSFNENSVKINSTEYVFQNQSATCSQPTRDFGDISTAAAWIFCFGLHFMGIIAFQILAEERGKGLISSLRRIGLYESAYWTSWFLSFQVLAIVGSALAVALAACIQSKAYPLQHIDYSVLFLLLWFGATCMLSNSFFLASLCSGPSISSALIISNFLAMIFTVAFANLTPLNQYMLSTAYDSVGNTISQCVLTPSTSNSVFQEANGYDIARFVVFFLPWFHISQAVSDILSTVQYGDNFTFRNIYSTPLYTLAPGNTFYGKYVLWSFGMMWASSVVFVAMAWFFGQLLPDTPTTEGRGILSILLPPVLKTFLFGETTGQVFEGDVRGQEKAQSLEDRSIRAYKVSKTYTGTQALREVSFSMNKGQLFVLLGHNGAGVALDKFVQ